MQLLLDFSTDHFETMHTCSTWSEDVHMVWGYPANFFQRFALFHLSLFQLLYDDVGSLWAQLLLQFYNKLFETLHVFLSCSENVHVLMGLSSHHFLSTFSTF